MFSRLAFVSGGALDKSLVRPPPLFNQEKNTRRGIRWVSKEDLLLSFRTELLFQYHSAHAPYVIVGMVMQAKMVQHVGLIETRLL